MPSISSSYSTPVIGRSQVGGSFGQKQEKENAGLPESTAPAPIVDLLDAVKSGGSLASLARAKLDENYSQFKRTGTAFNFSNSTQDQWNYLTDGLDRRSLYAIASNSGGQFTDNEQKIAQSVMSQRQGEAGIAADPLGTDLAARYKAQIAYLDVASAEEKSSFQWAEQRAATQYGYEASSRQQGKEPEKIDSDNPLVRLLKSAIDTLAKLDDPSKSLQDIPQYQQAKQIAATQAVTGSSKLVDRTA